MIMGRRLLRYHRNLKADKPRQSVERHKGRRDVGVWVCCLRFRLRLMR